MSFEEEAAAGEDMVVVVVWGMFTLALLMFLTSFPLTTVSTGNEAWRKQDKLKKRTNKFLELRKYKDIKVYNS